VGKAAIRLEQILSEANVATKEINERCNTIDEGLKQTQAQYAQNQNILMETRERFGEAKILASTHLSKLIIIESHHPVAVRNLERAELNQIELLAKFDGSNNALAAQNKNKPRLSWTN
jgi:hypothetical protein